MLAIKKLYQDLESDLDSDSVDDAMQRLSNWKQVNVSAESGIDLFDDPELITSAVSERQESLIKYPGALGTFFGSDLSRDSFVALMAPEKTGKTMWLLDMGLRGAQQGNKG